MKIRSVKAFVTAPEGVNLVVIKVETDEGITGYGCGTYNQRCLSVAHVIETYFEPLLIGRDPHKIEDIWNLLNVNAYWRNGPILNNAISGVDMALWDIKGKVANLPLYQLFGGKCREGVPTYVHAEGNSKEEVLEKVLEIKEQGYKYVRCQQGGYGGKEEKLFLTENPQEGAYYDPKKYMSTTVKLFEFLRKEIGDQMELLHDVHERLYPIDTINLAKRLEQFDLFYLEDALSPEQTAWFRTYRQQCSTPIAMGELFNNPSEWVGLVTERLIDFIRIHITQIGGITPAKKVIALCGTFNIRTAWHGPADVSPFGHAANVHLDLSTPNFGIQEWCRYSKPVYDVFSGIPEVRNGHLYVNEKPGLGVEFDEVAAAKYPPKNNIINWTQARHPDGTIFTP